MRQKEHILVLAQVNASLVRQKRDLGEQLELQSLTSIADCHKFLDAKDWFATVAVDSGQHLIK